jgi:hypothetical protein
MHYIEKPWGGQARKLDFSLRDNELAHLVNAKQICLKSNGLHRQAKVVCDGGLDIWALSPDFCPEFIWAK